MYIYIYMYIYERICVTHCLSCMYTHTHTEGRRGGGAEGRRGGGTKGQRDTGAEGQKGRWAEGRRGRRTGGRRDWGAEVRNGIMLGMFNSRTFVHPCSLAG